MKKVFFVTAGLFSLAMLQAQVKEGTIVYERKINMYRTIQDEQMRAMIPEFRTSKHMLLFSDSVSVYKSGIGDRQRGIRLTISPALVIRLSS